MNIFNKLKEDVINNKDKYITDYKILKNKIAESPAKYKGEPIDFLYQPLFLKEEDIENFKYAIFNINCILKKVTNEYLANKDFRKHFGFSEILEKLILKDPGYTQNIPIGRFDIFYHFNGDFEFCELNTDGSSAMTEVRELQKHILDSHAINELNKEYRFKGFELFDSLIDKLLDNYYEFSKDNKIPQIAIVDWIDKDPPSEFIEFKKAFENRGIKTIIADPRDLIYKDKKLYYKEFRIDCIYRRLVTFEIIEKEKEVTDFINAYLNDDVCVIGGLRSQLAHNKKIFSILHDENKSSFLNSEERVFIEKHIPYTTEFNINDERLIHKLVMNKDEYLVKPSDKYASKGVMAGKDFSTEEWKRIILNIHEKDYLTQKLCNIPNIPMAMFDDNNVSYENHNYIIGLFVYNEELKGVYVRTGRKNIIASLSECYSIPALVYVEKKSHK